MMRFVILKTTVGTLEGYRHHLREHLDYLQGLRGRQLLVSAASFDDRSGAVLTVEAAGLEEAIALARQDPLVREGVDTYQIHGLVPLVEEDTSSPQDPGQLHLFDAAQAGPLTPPPPDDGFRIAPASAEGPHSEFLTTCFLPNVITREDPVRGDYLRRSGRQGLRKLLLLLDGDIAGQIEFAPPEASGLPIEGPGVSVLHCLWVNDAYTGLTGGRMLLAACAEASGAQSLATVAYNSTLPWLPRSFFEKHGFVVVDQLETGRFFGNTPIVAYLLWRPLGPEAKPPSWNRAQLLEGVEFCPRYPWLSGKRLYWGHAFDYHGLVVKEGLRRPELLHQLPCLGTRRTDKWTLVKFGVPQIDLSRALDLIQAALLSEPTYYAHVYGADQMIIIYPDRVFRVTPDRATWDDAIRYGIDKGIPEEELIFVPRRFDEETF